MNLNLKINPEKLKLDPILICTESIEMWQQNCSLNADPLQRIPSLDYEQEADQSDSVGCDNYAVSLELQSQTFGW